MAEYTKSQLTEMIAGKLQRNFGALLVYLNLALVNGVVYSVVDINADIALATNTAATHVALIGNNKRGGNGVYGNARALIVISDCGDDGCNIVGINSVALEYGERHHSAAL